MGWWENRVLPHLVGASCGGAEIAGRRAEVCAGLEGEVLEIGFGSGLSCAHYPAAVTVGTRANVVRGGRVARRG